MELDARREQLENALLSVASHGRVLLSLAKMGRLTDVVIESSEMFFAAAAALATNQDAEPEVAADTACQHPVEARVDFGGMGGRDEWACAIDKGGCGYRHG